MTPTTKEATENQTKKQATELKQEKEKTEKKTEPTSSVGRHNGKYKFNGEILGKGRLVLAVVKEFVKKNPKATFKRIQEAFPNELHKQFPVVTELKEAKKMSEHYQRYFLKNDEVLKSADGISFAVTTQWGIGNINPFIDCAKKLGFEIKETNEKPVKQVVQNQKAPTTPLPKS